jgi:glycosyltransferase involved in cell wall biosynthesis
MRLYLAPLAEGFLRRTADQPARVLDLDEDDVLTNLRIARLRARNGDHAGALAQSGEAVKYQALAARSLPAFDRVLVSSALEMRQLARRFPATALAVVPNGAGRDAAEPRRTLPQALPQAPPQAPDVVRLLFVGALGYYPNEDAALFLCREVAPVLRRLTGRRLGIDIVGEGAGDAVLALQDDPDVRVHGFVEDLGPLHAAADVAVVPVRAGGGTRVKILEAFARRLPVVSTRLGAEGLDAADGRHLLLADDAEGFARACLKLKDDPPLAAALTGRAAKLFDAAHAGGRIHAAVAKAYESMECVR